MQPQYRDGSNFMTLLHQMYDDGELNETSQHLGLQRRLKNYTIWKKIHMRQSIWPMTPTTVQFCGASANIKYWIERK